MTDNKLTHFDASGNAVMVDVSEKTVTFREATAHGIITMNAEAFAAVESGTVKKGDVLGVARIAGIMATKRTSELIPLCHPLPLTKVSVDFRLLPERQAVEALCTVKTAGVTGVEMEALTGVSTALLTIYDMCKAVDKGMELGEIHLVEKTGGKSGHYIRAEAAMLILPSAYPLSAPVRHRPVQPALPLLYARRRGKAGAGSRAHLRRVPASGGPVWPSAASIPSASPAANRWCARA